jgi:amidase
MQRREFMLGSSALALTALSRVPAQAATDEFVKYDGMGQAELVRSGQVSALELVEAAIARIEKINPILNAVVHKIYDEGRATAKGPLPDGPFKGVPYLIKDLSELKGAPLTYGSRLFEHNIADSDNGSVERAKQAGLVIIGKTNTPEFGFISTTESQLLGAARNPYNPAYHTGGSSGGAGAAVAAGLVPFAQASDGGGSIRIPASVNGLVGLKPSRGRLYTREPAQFELDISVRLAVTRSVRDTAQILNAAEMKGATATLPPTGFIAGPSQKRLKIAFSTRSLTGTDAEPDVRRATRRAAALCADLGHNVDEINDTIIGPEFLENFLTIWAAGAHGMVSNARLIGLTQGRWVNRETVFEPWTLGLADMFERRREKDPDILQKAIAYGDEVAAAYAAFFEDYDVLLTPVLRRAPLLIGEQDSGKSFDALYDGVLDYVPYTPQYNVAGNPAISLPLYMSSKGLPIGSQFAARFGGEATLLHLAYELEKALPWADRWPEVSALRLS